MVVDNDTSFERSLGQPELSDSTKGHKAIKTSEKKILLLSSKLHIGANTQEH